MKVSRVGAHWVMVGVATLVLFGATLADASLVTVGINVFPRTLDPTFDTSAQAQGVYRAMYEPLITIGEGGAVKPALAQSWKDIDPLTWRITLRKGVRFHNGQEFTSADVKFTLERVLDAKTKAPWKPRITLVEKIETPDPFTVVIKTSQPFGTLMKNLAVIYILPAKLWQTKGDENFLDPPVGTGPFKFVQWTKESVIQLARNDSYWGKKPQIDSLVFKHMPEASTRLAALEAGEVDLIYEVPPEQVERLKGKGYQVSPVPIGFSQVVQLKTTMGGPLTDKRVRQAMNYAVDKDAIVKSLFLGYAMKLEGQLAGPDGFGYGPGLKAYPYDPAKAKELLREAGYPQGFEVVWETAIGQYPKDRELVEVVAAQLAEVGIRAKVNVLERAARTAKVYAGTVGPVFTIAWQYLPAMDLELPYSFHLSESIWNLMKEPEFDRLFVEQRRVTTEGERLAALRKLSAWFRDYAPEIFLYQIVAIYATKPQVERVGFRPDLTLDFTEANVRR